MADAKGGGDHGHGGGGLGSKMFGLAAGLFAIIVVVNGGVNLLSGKHFLDGFGSANASSPQNFQGLTTNMPRVGYIQGAPINASDCIRRGGRVVNNGRSCEGYR